MCPPRRCAEQLVSQIAVTRLRVDELKAAGLSQPGRGNVVVDDALNLIVRQHAHATGESPVENWMMAGGERCRFVPHIGPREAPRVRNLQAQIQIAIGVRIRSVAVSRNQLVTKAGDGRLRRGRQHQLIRIGAAVVANGNGFATPHQLRAADAEVPPSPAGQLARLAARRAVPAFHRQDAEAVADANTVNLNRLRQRA